MIQRQALKDEKLQQMHKQAAETVIQSFTEDGFQLRAEYEPKRVRLDFTLGDGKVVTLKVDYENLTTGLDNIKALMAKLDK